MDNNDVTTAAEAQPKSQFVPGQVYYTRDGRAKYLVLGTVPTQFTAAGRYLAVARVGAGIVLLNNTSMRQLDGRVFAGTDCPDDLVTTILLKPAFVVLSTDRNPLLVLGVYDDRGAAVDAWDHEINIGSAVVVETKVRRVP